jgi:phosphohistidine swiveling domain-containing protein
MKKYYSPLEVNSVLLNKVGHKAFKLSALSKLEIETTNRIFISADFCEDFKNNDFTFDLQDITTFIDTLKSTSKTDLQAPDKPLILAIRPSKLFDADRLTSVLNIGFNDTTVEELGKFYLRPKFAYESYYLFVTKFLNFCYGISFEQIKSIENKFLESRKISHFKSIKVNELKELISIFFNFAEKNHFLIPENLEEQIAVIMETYYSRWYNKDFQERKIKQNNDLKKGLPLILEEMTFGNLGENSGSVKFYSRNPNFGDKQIYGEIFRNYQLKQDNFRDYTFEDIQKSDLINKKDLNDTTRSLEQYLKEDLLIEGIIEDKKLRITNLKEIPKTIAAEVKICNSFQDEKILDFTDALNIINSDKLHLYETYNCQASLTDISFAKGVGICKGGASGRLLFDYSNIQACLDSNTDFILFLDPLNKIDYEKVKFAKGIMQYGGSKTTDLADVCRELNIPCIGIDKSNQINGIYLYFDGNKSIKNGDYVSFDADSESIFKSQKKLVINSDTTPILDLIEKAKEYTPCEIFNIPESIYNINSDYTKAFFYNPLELIKSSLNDLNKLKALFGLLTQNELIDFKNKLRANLESVLTNIQEETISITLPYDILQSLIPKNKDVFDFVEISKLDFDYVQKRILNVISKSESGLIGSNVFIENQKIFAIIIQAYLEAMCKKQTSVDSKLVLYLSNLNSSSEYLFFQNLINEAKDKLCPQLNLELGLTITTSRGVVNYNTLSEISKNILIDVDSLVDNFYGFSNRSSNIPEKLTKMKIWDQNYQKEFDVNDLGVFLEGFVKKKSHSQLGIKNSRGYKKSFKNWLKDQSYDFLVVDEKWLLNSIVNLAGNKE